MNVEAAIAHLEKLVARQQNVSLASTPLPTRKKPPIKRRTFTAPAVSFKSADPKDPSGLRFGALLVLGPDRDHTGRRGWRCRCDCGKEPVVRNCELFDQRSCGCGLGRRLMVTGEYRYRMDRKGRLVFPAPLLREFGCPFWITRGTPGFALILADGSLPQLARSWVLKPESLALWFGALHRCEVGDVSRFMVPACIREWLGANPLQSPELCYVGMGDAVLLTSAECWDDILRRAVASLSDQDPLSALERNS
jgi:DNA-binding transcriptional regulator/RsmH inhibitor MraZ